MRTQNRMLFPSLSQKPCSAFTVAFQVTALALWIAAICAIISQKTLATIDVRDPEYFQRPGVRVSEIVRVRGYLAEEHWTVSKDGYVLGLTRASNPLISKKRTRRLGRKPILFVHGTLVDGNSFVMNSFDIERARDFSHIDASKLSEGQLIEMFGSGEPSAKSLAFFAMNMGHEVWFLHRRGTSMSQRRVGLAANEKPPPTVMEKYLASIEYDRNLQRSLPRPLRAKHTRRRPSKVRSKRQEPDGNAPAGPATEQAPEAKEAATKSPNSVRKKSNTKLVAAIHAAPQALLDYGNLLSDLQKTFDKRLWNHSLDEQAAYDLPVAVDYVLEQTGFERTVIVGDSSGGALIIMSLILEPKMNKKLSKAVAWVPSFNIGHVKHHENFSLVQPIFNYVGPYPFTFLSHPIQALMELTCSLEIMQQTLCTMAADSTWGDSFGQAPVRTEFQSAYLVPVSAHEYLQLIQMHTRKQARLFDFRDKAKNMLAYGLEDPPRYDASLINFEHLSIYVGKDDSLVTEADIETIHRELKVPHRIVHMNAPGVNHGAVMFHEKVAKLVILPTYKDIVSYGYDGQKRRLDGDREEENFFNNILD